ncbi:ribonuclease [Streptococcus dysgalactiae]|uniref:transglutaminase domain-containing protein n=1 Tax=Streptococcus dysgalactiae TaxID=1334 RepID=UPI000DFB838E|nr:transglutaminase domain-containing protein [Streptococcus dysgalactiae]QQT03837.1 ribonuclease [Streptococcus dysgalactiae]SUN46611.1 Kyphoscoliosis peptidase [Streptococcus dysgalactiae subsp. dysgalactiae]SUN51396.1 Kyphoscoliosis peptidase [Streptococcus dysgalactiae]SUN55750.1 Kyphoscoliosis peptidase [Streptococcus dysgalactiae]
MKKMLGQLGIVALSTCFLVAPLYVKADTNQASMVSRELDRKDHLSQTDHLEKVSISTDQIIEGVIQERGGDKLTGLNAYVLGTDKHFRVWPFEMERNLADHLGSDYVSKYDFVKVNHGWSSGGNILLLIPKGSYVLNNLEEYNALVRKTIQGFDLTEKLVVASFDLTESVPLKLLLANAGLSIGQQSRPMTIGSQTFYSRNIRMMNYVEGIGSGSIGGYENSNASLERYLANDEKIKALIEESGAMKETTEKERLRKWCLYVTNTFDYDLEGSSIDNKQAYYRASDIFSVTERQKAVCVGYSAITARALNLMGIKAYVVGGVNYNGIPHQVTRVHYDGAWYYLDTTSGNRPGKKVQITHFGRNYTPVEMSVREANGFREMEYSKAFEDWMMRSNPSEWLVYGRNLQGEKASATTYLDDQTFAELFKNQSAKSHSPKASKGYDQLDGEDYAEEVTMTSQGSVFSNPATFGGDVLGDDRNITFKNVVSHGTWYHNDQGQYRYAVNGQFVQNQWVKDNNDYYYCGSDCNVVTGSYQIEGKWYVFDQFGRLT